MEQNIVTLRRLHELISKKDLLVMTGISYGQLYRWKREKLIPEDWFIKQPSFTGQETFFPRDKMLSRIKAIQELKDKYSLEELSKILSPEVAERSFSIDDLSKISEIYSGWVTAFTEGFEKNNFNYIEVVIMVAISELRIDCEIPVKQACDLVRGIRGFLDKIKSTGYILVIFDIERAYYASLYQEQATIFMDNRFRIVKEIRLNDISSKLKIKYRNKFNFEFSDEVIDQSSNEYSRE
jgi:hypothetical protein